MDWITNRIAIGNFREAMDEQLLKTSKVRSILSLDGTLQDQSAEALSVEDIAVVTLIDGPGNDPRRFQTAVDTLKQLVEQIPPVLVHCHAGRSRSVAVVAGYLVITQDLPPHQALGRIKSRRRTFVAPELEALVRSVSSK